MGKVTCGHTNRKNFSKGNCQQCAQVIYAQGRQQRLRERQVNTPPERINPETELTHTLREILSILVAELLPRQNVCQGRGKIAGCTGKPTEVHHGKGRDGFRIILSKYFKYLCRNCHDFCTENSTEAIDMELSYRRNSPTDWSFTERELELIKEYGLRLPKESG
jgi:hypothetical protein